MRCDQFLYFPSLSFWTSSGAHCTRLDLPTSVGYFDSKLFWLEDGILSLTGVDFYISNKRGTSFPVVHLSSDEKKMKVFVNLGKLIYTVH